MDKALETDLHELQRDIEEIERVLQILRPDGAEFGFWRRCVDQAINRRGKTLSAMGLA